MPAPSPASQSPVQGGRRKQQQQQQQQQHHHHQQQQRGDDDEIQQRAPQRQQSGDSYLLQHAAPLHQRRTPSPLPPHMQHMQHHIDGTQSPASAASFGERAQSVPLGWATQIRPGSAADAFAFNAAAMAAAAKHRGSPIDTTSAGLAKRRTTVHLDDSSSAQKRPMSPHITSATPTSASARHSALGHHHQPSPSPSHFAGTSAISKRDSIHSPLSAGAISAPWLNDAVRYVGQVNDDSQPHNDDDDDDEAGKGHGGRMSVPPIRPESKPFFPLSTSPSALQSSDGATADQTTGASLSPSIYGNLAADAPIASTSPIIVPQARRGAINLKKASRASVGLNGEQRERRRRRRRRRRHDEHGNEIREARAAGQQHWRSESNESSQYGPYYTSHHRRTHTNEAASYPLSHRPALSSMRSIASILLWNTVQALIHPHTTAVRIGRWFMRTLREIDDAFRDPRTRQRTWKPEWLDAYVPFLIWLGISLSSTGTVIIFHTRVFTALDELSQTLQRLGLGGQFVMGGLIFLTTFPPMPLYSTLIVLCGFSFGMIEGFIISYIAALSGAITVFLLSRTLLRGWMTGLLNKSGGLKKVVRAIEKQPKLLFLIRLAPYPYNLMNTLLASSPTLTFKTYTLCTALALPKLLVHTGLGTSIKNFAAYHGAEGGSGTAEESDEEKARSATAERVKRIAGLVGVLLCIGIFFYLMHVARKAVDNLDDEDDQLGKPASSGREAGGDAGSSGTRRYSRASVSSSYATRHTDGTAETQRLYPDGDDDDSLYSDETDVYSGDSDFSDSDEEDFPALDGGRVDEDSHPGNVRRPLYGRTPSTDGAELDMRDTGVGFERRYGQQSSAGPLGPAAGGGGLVGRVKAGLGLGGRAAGDSSARYGLVPHSGEAHLGRSDAAAPTAVPMSVVSSVSTPLASLPVSLANGSVQGGRRAVVGGSGPGVLGVKPRTSGVGERSAYLSQAQHLPINSNSSSGNSIGVPPGRLGSRAFPAPRLGSALPPAAGTLGHPSNLSPIVGTPGVAIPSSYLPSPYNAASGASPSHPGAVSTTDGGAMVADGEPDGQTLSMEDRIAQMEENAEEYFSAGRRWAPHQSMDGANASTAAAAEALELQRLAQQQRRGGSTVAGGPRSASEMGAEEARYGHQFAGV